MNIEQHITEYRQLIQTGLDAIDQDAFDGIQKILVSAFNSRNTIFVCGNGGSAAIAEHFTCDYSKGISSNTKFFPKFISLTSNVSLLTAYANDIDYSQIYALQLNNLAEKNDVLIAISSSGNSPNIIKVIQAAKMLGLKIITLTGFNGGAAKLGADINIHIPINNYGVVEDCHHMVMHMVAQYIRKSYTTTDINLVKL